MEQLREKARQIMEKLRQHPAETALGIFAVVTAVLVVVGVCIGTPATAMGMLAVLATAVAVLLHRVPLWIHALLLLTILCVGVAASVGMPAVLTVLVYAAATAALQVLDKGEKQNGQQ